MSEKIPTAVTPAPASVLNLRLNTVYAPRVPMPGPYQGYAIEESPEPGAYYLLFGYGADAGRQAVQRGRLGEVYVAMATFLGYTIPTASVIRP